MGEFFPRQPISQPFSKIPRGSTSLQVDSIHLIRSCKLHLSGHNIQADCQRHTLVPPFNSGANAAPVSIQVLPVHCHYSGGTDVGHGSVETTGNRVFDIMYLT